MIDKIYILVKQLKHMAKVNPYVEKFFGEWFKKVVMLILLIIGGSVICYGVPNGWIDQTFAIEILFLVVGLFLGGWLSNDK